MRYRTALFVALALGLAGCEADTQIAQTGSTNTTAPPSTPAPFTSTPTTPTTRATTTTTGVTEGPLGTTFTVSPGDRKITAYTFRSPVTASNSYTKPKDGFTFAAVEVQECAGPAGEKFTPNRFDFELALTDNTRVRAAVEVMSPQMASSPLLAGDCIRGWVSFEVPTGGTVRHIVYSVGNASAKWRAVP